MLIASSEKQGTQTKPGLRLKIEKGAAIFRSALFFAVRLIRPV